MAAFHLIIYGRFWVITKDVRQRIVGPDRPFIGPQERIGELLGVSASMIGDYIKWGMRAGVLTRTKVYVPHELAAEYTFDLSRVQKTGTPP